jgi:hypothetical protein
MDALLAQEHAIIEAKARELAGLHERLAKLTQLNGEVQRRRAASAHKRREARVEALLAELMALPTALPDASVLDPQQMLEPVDSSRPPSGEGAAHPVTPSPRVAKRPPQPVSKTKASPAPPKPSPGQRKPAQPPPKQGPPKLSPAAAALASQMVDSPYNRPSRVLAAAAAANAVVKR